MNYYGLQDIVDEIDAVRNGAIVGKMRMNVVAVQVDKLEDWATRICLAMLADNSGMIELVKLADAFNAAMESGNREKVIDCIEVAGCMDWASIPVLASAIDYVRAYKDFQRQDINDDRG